MKLVKCKNSSLVCTYHSGQGQTGEAEEREMQLGEVMSAAFSKVFLADLLNNPTDELKIGLNRFVCQNLAVIFQLCQLLSNRSSLPLPSNLLLLSSHHRDHDREGRERFRERCILLLTSHRQRPHFTTTEQPPDVGAVSGNTGTSCSRYRLSVPPGSAASPVAGCN